ncbi:hypothetical protein [Primorskyibacter sp. 2E107]|uniref:hypothetical protein n=1 Tax=Primorskyibacter sp. 2E107 TaxID=3403458 RepID=UPI003AF70E58
MAAFDRQSADSPTLLVELGGAGPGFDAFGVCTEAGPTILSEDGGDPALCGASAEARIAAHRTIAQRIIAFLKENDQL